MESSRKQIIAKIAMMEKALHYQQLNVIKHKKYLLCQLQDNRLVLVLTLLPAFLWGWQTGKEKGWVNKVNRAIRWGYVTLFSHLKKQFFSLYRQSQASFP